MPAIAVDQLRKICLTDRYRRQASSYRGFGVFSGVVELQQKVWADLAFQRGHVVFGVAHVFMH